MASISLKPFLEAMLTFDISHLFLFSPWWRNFRHNINSKWKSDDVLTCPSPHLMICGCSLSWHLQQNANKMCPKYKVFEKIIEKIVQILRERNMIFFFSNRSSSYMIFLGAFHWGKQCIFFCYKQVDLRLSPSAGDKIFGMRLYSHRSLLQ